MVHTARRPRKSKREGRSGCRVKDSVSNRMDQVSTPSFVDVPPLGQLPIQKEQVDQLQKNSAQGHMPLAVATDLEWAKFQLRSPYPTVCEGCDKCSNPNNPISYSSTMSFYERMSEETLFFIFYYVTGTKAQWLAAKFLKGLTWRFHTKYGMWFRRVQEPKIWNKDFEQGSYYYFDTAIWKKMVTHGFVFEYCYLENIHCDQRQPGP